MDVLLRDKVNYQYGRFQDTLDKADKERYRYASLLEQLAVDNKKPTDYVTVDDLEKHLFWKEVYEVKQSADKKIKDSRFIEADRRDALRAARKSKNVAPKRKK